MALKRKRFIQARKAAGYTQESLAEALHVDRSTVVRWESGKSEPQPYIRPKMSRLLCISRRELSELLTLEGKPTDPPSTVSEAPGSDAEECQHGNSNLVLPAQSGRRRSFGAEFSRQTTYLESIELNRQLEASSLGVRTLDQLDLTVESLGIDYLHVPPKQTLRDAGITRRLVIDVLDGRHTLTQRKHLYSLAGWLSALIGHGSFDIGESFSFVDGHLGTALHLADEVDHGELIAWIRGTQALSAIFHNRPEAAIQFAQAGQKAARECSIMTVRLLAQEARGHARLGHRKLSEKCMAAAERSFDDVLDPLTTSIFSFDRPYLSYYAGTCYTWLERPGQAEKCSREAIILCDRAAADWPVARVFARIDLAEALIQQNELDEAAELARDCLKICIYGRRN